MRACGFRVHAVGEGYRERPGWVGTDARFADVVHAAERSWVKAFLELLTAARVAASGRRTLVAHPRSAF